ncbi:MAG: hypothetical protein JSU94_04800 [Phycisphaerales bacterium]|nr:MAG: hypothetical protein JSU94_04800 [Phycisphaerales bacterium]
MREHTKICTAVFLLATALSPARLAGSQDQEHAPELQKILDAIRQQGQMRLEKSFHLSVLKTTTYSNQKTGLGQGISLTKQQENLKLLFTADGRWLSRSQKNMTLSDKSVQHREYTETNDGVLFRTLEYEPDNPYRDDPPYRGNVLPAASYQKSGIAMLHNVIGLPQRELKLLARAIASGQARLGQAEKVAGQNCLVVEYRGSRKDDGLTTRFWLNPAKGYLPQRIDALDNEGRLRKRYQARNIEKVGSLWLPQSAQTLTYLQENAQDKSPKVSTQETVKLLTLDLDFTVSQEIFKLEFPTGTEVQDAILGEHFIVGQPKEIDDATMRQPIFLGDAPPAMAPTERGRRDSGRAAKGNGNGIRPLDANATEAVEHRQDAQRQGPLPQSSARPGKNRSLTVALTVLAAVIVVSLALRSRCGKRAA